MIENQIIIQEEKQELLDLNDLYGMKTNRK